MSMELFLLSLVAVAALPYLLFSLTYPFRTKWWRSTAGRALMISTPAVAILLITELAFALFPVSERVELVATIVTLSLIAVGGWLKYGALVHELRHDRAKP